MGKSGEYCKTFGEREAADDEVLVLMEANDNHVEEHTVAEFLEFCINGRKWPIKSGTWTSKGTGKNFESGVEAGGQMVDQRFLPRIDEGEARFVVVGTELNRVEHYVYIGGVGGETKTTIYKPGDKDFPYTEIQEKLQKEIPIYLKALGLPDDALPLLWAADFIPVSDHKSPLVIGELYCCLGKYREFAMLGHRLALFRSVWVRRQSGDTPVGRHKIVKQNGRKSTKWARHQLRSSATDRE